MDIPGSNAVADPASLRDCAGLIEWPNESLFRVHKEVSEIIADSCGIKRPAFSAKDLLRDVFRLSFKSRLYPGTELEVALLWISDHFSVDLEFIHIDANSTYGDLVRQVEGSIGTLHKKRTRWINAVVFAIISAMIPAFLWKITINFKDTRNSWIIDYLSSWWVCLFVAAVSFIVLWFLGNVEANRRRKMFADHPRCRRSESRKD